MLNRYAFLFALATVAAGCGSPDEPHPIDAGHDADACNPTRCDEGNPCVLSTCGPDGCERTVLAAGTICVGAATDPIHGECDGDPVAPGCEIIEWTCLRNPPGTACIGGICDGHQNCCSGGCIDAQGFCSFGGSGGKPCP